MCAGEYCYWIKQKNTGPVYLTRMLHKPDWYTHEQHKPTDFWFVHSLNIVANCTSLIPLTRKIIFWIVSDTNPYFTLVRC